jgi:mRNA-degrading endonuclease RelE of RelBE toxin-antitoxin system
VVSKTSPRFRRLYRELPAEVRAQARTAYRLFQENPFHPGLQFKRVSRSEPLYSARVGLHYRVVGLLVGGVITWGWIGSHGDYDKLLSRR